MPQPDETSALLGDAWEQLPGALVAAGAAVGITADGAAETVGLLVEPFPAKWSYDATPPHSVTFASTGGDGVHFGVLTDAGQPGPVVMTVPLNFNRPNLILGADLHDFLNLGCHFGYFALEQLVYDFEATVREIEAAPTHQRDGDEAVVLGTLRERLGLRNPTHVQAHLVGLQTRFGLHLDNR
jgi:hypothetical protein